MRRQSAEWIAGGRGRGGEALTEGGSETRNAIHSSARTSSEQAGRREKVSGSPPSMLHRLYFLKRLSRSAPACLPSPSLPSFTLVCMPPAARLRLIDCHRLKPLHSLIHKMMDLYISLHFLRTREYVLSESGFSEQFPAAGRPSRYLLCLGDALQRKARARLNIQYSRSMQR